MLPFDLIDLILQFHRPMCTMDFTGRPEFTLYWVYDMKALERTLKGQGDVRRVDSALGSFFKSRQRPCTGVRLSSAP